MSSAECLREFVKERLSAAAEEIFTVFKQTIVEYEEEIDRQRRLLDIVWKPEIKLHRIELQHVCNKEEGLTEEQLFIQERNSSLDQEDPDPPQIKEEQEEISTGQQGEQLEMKQETDTFESTPADEESDHSGDQTLSLHPDETTAAVEKVNIPEPSEPDSDHQLLSLQVTKRRDLKGSKSKTKNQHRKSSRPGNNRPSTMSEVDYDSDTSKKSLQCGICGRELLCKSKLQRHLRTHTGERPYTCKICKKSFCDNSALNRHTTIHTGEKPHTCKICGRAFKLKREVAEHTKRAHTRKNPHLCKTCGKRFNHVSVLKRHMIIHTGEKPFVCSTCGKRFNDITTVTLHMRIHTGEKPYQCKVCGREFRQSSTLTSHMRIHTSSKKSKTSAKTSA
ncbi:hypothetical protein L3Q82_024559, partial [Scortum barcoo]